MTFQICLWREWPLFCTNEIILFTKSTTTSECHNIFGWLKKHYLTKCLRRTKPLSISRFLQLILPKMVCIGLKMAQKCPFSTFLQIIFCAFYKISLKRAKTFTLGHNSKSRRAGLPKLHFLWRLTLIFQNIFHKVSLNRLLIINNVPLKKISKQNYFGLSNGIKNGPKMTQNGQTRVKNTIIENFNG